MGAMSSLSGNFEGVLLPRFHPAVVILQRPAISPPTEDVFELIHPALLQAKRKQGCGHANTRHKNSPDMPARSASICIVQQWADPHARHSSQREIENSV